MGDLAAADKWIYATLSADATLLPLIGGRVYDTLAAAGTALPYVVFSYQGGYDVRGNGPIRVLHSGLYLVKAIGQGTSFATLAPIAARIDALLHAKHGVNTDGDAWAVREQPFKYLEIDNGVQYRHLGGLYRVWVQGA